MDAKEKPVTETIAVRKLPEGTKTRLSRVAEINGRSLEAEARYAIKQHLAFHLSGGVPIPEEAGKRDLATERAEAHVLAIQTRRDSVIRKLEGGSNAVTVDALRELDRELMQARLKLGEVCSTHPLAASGS